MEHSSRYMRVRSQNMGLESKRGQVVGSWIGLRCISVHHTLRACLLCSVKNSLIFLWKKAFLSIVLLLIQCLRGMVSFDIANSSAALNVSKVSGLVFSALLILSRT